MAYKILVVDDDECIRLLLDATLKQHGYEVLLASNGQEALRLIETNIPDLMIVDLSMPVMSGWYFSMKAHADPRYQLKPIIILSGLLESAAKPEKFEPGTFNMPKPFDIFKLLEKIKELLKEPQSL